MTLLFIVQNQHEFQYRGYGPIADLKERPAIGVSCTWPKIRVKCQYHLVTVVYCTRNIMVRMVLRVTLLCS